jgi:hypothetical protein
VHALRLLHLLAVERLRVAVAMRLLAERHAVLRLRMVVAVALLAEGHTVLRLRMAMALLTHRHPLLPAADVSANLLTLLVLRAHGKARVAVAATRRLHLETAAAVAVATAAVERLHAEAAASATAMASAAAVELGALSAAAAATMTRLRGTAAVSATAAIMAAATVRSRSCRGCDRERGNAGREENPGHIRSPLNGKTVRSAHRSNRQTDGTCGLPH